MKLSVFIVKILFVEEAVITGMSFNVFSHKYIRGFSLRDSLIKSNVSRWSCKVAEVSLLIFQTSEEDFIV